jgi:hypothetical protein
MGAKLPQPAPNRNPDGTLKTDYKKPEASPAPPPNRLTLKMVVEMAEIMKRKKNELDSTS